jgi:HSP20 family protein
LQGNFLRQLFLGEGLDADHVEAAYDDGVLTVTIPIAEQAKPRKVEITSGGAAKEIETSSSAP